MPVSFRQIAGSMSLLPFPSTDVMPGIAFPLPCGSIVGPLGLGSPRVQAEVVPSPAVPCVATTAFVRPGRFAFAPFRYLGLTRFSFVSLPAGAEVGSSTGRVGQ
jgi:hypothetical protein